MYEISNISEINTKEIEQANIKTEAGKGTEQVSYNKESEQANIKAEVDISHLCNEAGFEIKTNNVSIEEISSRDKLYENSNISEINTKEIEQANMKTEADIAPSKTVSSRNSFNTTEQVNHRKEIEKINLEREADIEVKIHNEKEIEAKETISIYSSTFRVWLGILMTLITPLTTGLNSVNFTQVSLNQEYSTINRKSSFNNIRRPDSKNAISKMSKSEDKKLKPASKNVASDMGKSGMISDSTTPIPISKITVSNLNNVENIIREPRDIFDSFPNSKNIVNNNSTRKHKVYNGYNANKQLLMKVDLPRPQYNSGALREIKHNSKEVNTVNNLYQATISGLMHRTILQGKYNRRQYFFESRPNYFFRIIRQAVLCRTSS